MLAWKKISRDAAGEQFFLVNLLADLHDRLLPGRRTGQHQDVVRAIFLRNEFTRLRLQGEGGVLPGLRGLDDDFACRSRGRLSRRRWP